MKGQLVTSDEAKIVLKQHTTACIDCPFARCSLNGWLGGNNIGEWLQMAHGDGDIECHTKVLKDGGSTHCAGAAIYRHNVAKSCTFELPVDTKTVFATPLEFAKHHSKGKIKTFPQVREVMTEALIKAIEKAQFKERRSYDKNFHNNWTFHLRRNSKTEKRSNREELPKVVKGS